MNRAAKKAGIRSKKERFRRPYTRRCDWSNTCACCKRLDVTMHFETFASSPPRRAGRHANMCFNNYNSAARVQAALHQTWAKRNTPIGSLTLPCSGNVKELILLVILSVLETQPTSPAPPVPREQVPWHDQRELIVTKGRRRRLSSIIS